jgi:hypothetical protein
MKDIQATEEASESAKFEPKNRKNLQLEQFDTIF